MGQFKDEGKPTCKRCEKSGYACAGYDTGIHFINTSTAPIRAEKNTSTVKYIRSTPVTVVPRMRPATTIPNELSLIAFQPDVFLSFMYRNFVWRTYGSGWLESAATDKLDPLSSQSIKALSTIFFGISHHQEDIQWQGAMQHGKLLGLVRPALANPKKLGVENLVIPIVVMLMHAVSLICYRPPFVSIC